jgi:hypothetical protein
MREGWYGACFFRSLERAESTPYDQAACQPPTAKFRLALSEEVAMRTRHQVSLPSLAIAGLVVLCGCGAHDKTAGGANPEAMTSKQAKAAVADVAIGHQVGAGGTITGDQKGNNFTAGQPVMVALTVGKAPVGTPVTIDWYGPNGQQLATDQKTVENGNQAISFASKDTSAWGQGDYHADLSVGGQKIDTERFSIVPAEKTDSSDKQAAKAISNVTVGHQLGAAGAIANGQEGKNFQPGQPVYIAFVTGNAAPGTTVEVDWYGPNEQKLGNDQKQIASGDTVAHFAATQTSGWGLGDYRADLLVDGQKVDTEHFSIVNATKADQQASSGSR